jgi:hypothetical protein
MNKLSSSKALLDIPQYPSENVRFIIGDIVRSYRSGFSEKKPFKNHFIEGVVIEIESWVKENDYLKVKWHFENYFGTICKFKAPHNGSDTFSISVNSPWLVKVNKFQLALAI